MCHTTLLICVRQNPPKQQTNKQSTAIAMRHEAFGLL
jgi:hypothetical protein